MAGSPRATVRQPRPIGVSRLSRTLATVRAMCVVGARPNFMKIKPVMDALDRRGTERVLVHSGQHYDASMSTVFFDELGIRPPDRWLEVGSGSHAEQAARAMLALEPVMAEVQADVVVVVSDVNSTMAAALVAAKSPARLAHVEAGLRSRDWTMPEEVNRLVTDSVSDDLLAPSADAVDNLVAEGHPRGRVHLVGNVMIDTLLANLERARARGALGRLGLSPGGYGLVTLHRPANVDHVEMFKGPPRGAGTGGGRLPPRPARAPPGGACARRPRGAGRGPHHRAARVPRLRGPGGVGPAGTDRFRRRAGGDDGPGRALPDVA